MKTTKAIGYREQGVSLIELMVAITIGLLIAAGLISLMASTSASRSELQKINMQIENGRYAFEVLADDLRHAGYYGLYRPARTTSVTPPPDACATAAATMLSSLGFAVQGISNFGSANTATIRGAIYSCLPASAIVAGTDVLAIRRVSTESYALTSAGVNTSLVTNVPYLQSGIVPDPSNSAQTTIGVALDVATSTTVSLTIFRAKMKDAGTGTSASNPATFNPPAPLRQYLVHIYFISPCSQAVLDCGSSGDGIPSLKRLSLGVGPAFPSTVPEVIASGIENMQLDFGINTASTYAGNTYYDGAPGTFSECSATSATTYDCDWQDVVAVRVNLLARNNDKSPGYTDTRKYSLGLKYPDADSTDSSKYLGPFNDGYKRHVYSGLVRVNNVSMSRECKPTSVSPC